MHSPFRLKSSIGHRTRLVLAVIPFLLIVICYAVISHQRLQANPKDRYAPGIAGFVEGWERVWKLNITGYVEVQAKEGDTTEALAERFSGSARFAENVKCSPPLTDPVTGEERALKAGETVRVPQTSRNIVEDTKSSMTRLFVGLSVSVLVSLFFGILAGSYTHLGAMIMPIATGLAKIPPLAVLPIIFMLSGVGETSKIVIIVFGVAPTMTLDIYQRVLDMSQQLIIKAYTLGATSIEIIVDVILPMLWPSIIHGVRLALGPAWVYLIAAEAIGAQDGLGVRIFLAQRFGMSVILIYIAWIMVIGLLLDWALMRFSKWQFPWAQDTK